LKIETTLNLDTAVRQNINLAAQALGITKSQLVVQCMRQVVVRYDHGDRHSLRVGYQRRSTDGVWMPLHITVDHREYERFLDLRKFCKRSVSFLVAFALAHYLKRIMRNVAYDNVKDVNTDNYRFKHYIVIKEITKYAICWRIYWGLPPTLRLNQHSNE